MTRDEALALADRILALVNAQPSTPSRDELADAIEDGVTEKATVCVHCHRPWNDGVGHAHCPPEYSAKHVCTLPAGTIVNDDVYRDLFVKAGEALERDAAKLYDALQAQVADAINKRGAEKGDRPGALFCCGGNGCFCFECIAKRDAADKGMAKCLNNAIDEIGFKDVKVVRPLRDAERVKYAIVTAIREKDIPDAGFDPRCAHCGGAWNDGDGHAHCCPPEFRETVGGMRLMEEFERRYPVRCATCAHSISGDPQIACNGKPYCSVCFPEREAIEKRHWEVLNAYIESKEFKAARLTPHEPDGPAPACRGVGCPGAHHGPCANQALGPSGARGIPGWKTS